MKYDNGSSKERVKRAKMKVSELVKKGARLNPDAASVHYNKAIIKNSAAIGERAKSKKALAKKAASGGYK